MDHLAGRVANGLLPALRNHLAGSVAAGLDPLLTDHLANLIALLLNNGLALIANALDLFLADLRHPDLLADGA